MEGNSEEKIEKLKQVQDEMMKKTLNQVSKKEDIDLIKNIMVNPISENEDRILDKISTYNVQSDLDDYDDGSGYDVLELPSKGLVYPHKIGKLKVAHLTAADEDFITSPNLYKDGKIIDVILRRKILDKRIDPKTLCQGDIDAILLWLRADGYGPNFPVSVTDSSSKERFETTIDLTELKFKEFNLTPDDEGLFSFTLPLSKKNVKFKFSSRHDDLKFEEFVKYSDKSIRKIGLMEIVNDLSDYLKTDLDISKENSKNINQCIGFINNYVNSINTSDIQYNRTVTYRLTNAIVEFDGERDKVKIENIVRNMRAGDASALRQYISKNEPGVDFTIEVKNPRGGSFKTFLNIDSTILIYNS